MGETITQLQDALRKAIGEAKAGGKTFRSLAKDAGVNIASLTLFMSSKRDLRMAVAGRLCTALGLELVPAKAIGKKKRG